MEAFGGVNISRSIPSIVAAERNSLKKLSNSYRPCNLAFSDQSYLDYYSSSGTKNKIRCGAKGKVKQEKVMMKKRLKMLKGFSKDFAVFSDEMGSDHPFKARILSEAAELLREELHNLWSEKELKRTKEDEGRREKAAAAALMQNYMLESEMSSSSSSSSSESSDSDSDCGGEEVVDTTRMECNNPLMEQTKTLALPSTSNRRQDMQESIVFPSSETRERNSSTGFRNCCNPVSLERGGTSTISRGLTGCATPAAAAKKIEVCMGNKCKKSGSATLMEEFRRAPGIEEGTVSGCKCMGKCRYGPNVRISNTTFDDEVIQTIPQLCIGVGLEDVEKIVSNFLGDRWTQLDLAAASAS